MARKSFVPLYLLPISQYKKNYSKEVFAEFNEICTNKRPFHIASTTSFNFHNCEIKTLPNENI